MMIALVALLNLAFATLAGATLAAGWIDGMASPWSDGMQRSVRTLARSASVLTLLLSVLLLWVQVALMTELPLLSALPAVGMVLSVSHYGHAWLGSCAALLVIIGVQLRGGPRAVTGTAIVVFAVCRSLVSHAVMDGDLSWSVAIEAAHLLLASAWLGAVLVAAILLARPFGEGAGRYVKSLSRCATLALAGIIVTGSFNAWRALGSAQDLVATPWGLTLTAKLALVAIAVGLGAINRWHFLPTLLDGPTSGSEQTRRGFVRNLRIEAVVLVLALVAAALLSGGSPPGD